MYTLLHLLDSRQSLTEYRDAADLEASYSRYGVDGLEIIRAGDDSPLIRPETVIGYHLPFFANWMDFWTQNEEGLLDEFGSREVWEGFYGGKDPHVLTALFRRELRYADAAGAKYAAFHVSNVTTKEGFSYRYGYTDKQVADAAADLLNEVTRGQHFQVELLLENLFWPGLNYQDPAIAARLLERVEYPHTGLLLDTGHLMCTNFDLQDEAQACRYIHQILDRHGSLCGAIRGVHLHQSVTGAYVRKAYQNQPVLETAFYARFAQAYAHVLHIDTHQPMTDPGTPGLIERISPAYLTYEFTSANRAGRESNLAKQARVFGVE